MSKSILTFGLLLLSVTLFSQNVAYGVKAGVNIANLRGDYPDIAPSTINNKPKFGFHLGGFLTYDINEKIAVQPELLISTLGTILESDEGFTQNYKTTYLTIPVLLKYQVIEKFAVEVGAQIGFVLGAKVKSEFEDPNDPTAKETITVDLLKGGTYEFLGTTLEGSSAYKRFDFGFNLGASYEINESIFVQGRYHLGLLVVDEGSTNGQDFSSWNLKNSVFQISVGYQFN